MVSGDIQSTFGEVLERARILDPVNSRNWFEELRVMSFQGGCLEVGCPDDTKIRYLCDNCRGAFTRAAQQITGHLVAVDFKIAQAVDDNFPVASGDDDLSLHPDYTFKNFVVGPCNRLANASCTAVSQSLGNTYNPLFIYGNSGLGKTHLLHAVCHEVRRQDRSAQIKFLSCEAFVNRFIQAIEAGDLSGFQKQFRSLDLIVIDDVQFLREREQSQEEFFHTFNALYNNGKQIILSSDSAPSEIPSLEERLVSRFNWGLVTRVDPPSHDTRVAIVKKKAHLRDLDVSDEIAEYIARKVQANIRELEGALTTIYAVAVTSGQPITLELAQVAMEDQSVAKVRHISMSDIIDVVTEYFNVRLSDLQSKKRSQSIAEPRQVCMYLARKLTKHSLEEIGGHLGGRDHTTVMHACKKIDQNRENDPQTDAILKDLSKRITESQTPRSA